ncbi:MAG: putative glycoside hydrolase [Halanaerobiales bacterium]
MVLFIIIISSCHIYAESSELENENFLEIDYRDISSTEEINLEYDPLKIPEFLVKGIYVSGWAAGDEAKINRLIQLVNQSELNTMVIDVKDEFGHISYRSDVDMAGFTGANENKISNINQFLRVLKKNNIYTIARITVFKDPNLAKSRPDLSLPIKTSDDEIVFSREWVDPYLKIVRNYNIDLAKEAYDLGFDEVQFDYIRYPVIRDQERQIFTYGESKIDNINRFVSQAKKELAEYDRPLSIDVFGLTTSLEGGIGIGQSFRELAEKINIISPMVYPSHYDPGIFGIESPAEEPYKIIKKSIGDARQKTLDIDKPDVKIRPWLQDFSLGHRYTEREVIQQIKALDELGIEEWLLWNPGSKYTEEVFDNLR